MVVRREPRAYISPGERCDAAESRHLGPGCTSVLSVQIDRVEAANEEKKSTKDHMVILGGIKLDANVW